MSVSVAQIDDIPEIAEVMSKIGVPINVEVFSSYFFGTEKDDLEDGFRGGFVARDEAGHIVGYCGLTPFPIYVNRIRHTAYQMGVLGIQKGYGALMFDFMDRVVELTKHFLVIANTANEKSVRLWTQYAGFSSGPELGAFIQYRYLPLGLLTRPKFTQKFSFSSPEFIRFWEVYMSGQKGIVTDRSPARMARIFTAAMQQKRVAIVTLCEKGQLVGYAALRLRRFHRMPGIRYEIIDILALGDDERRVQQLAKKCMRFAEWHGGIMLEYVGGRALLPRRRPALANTSFWSGGPPEVQEAIKSGEGWFFGPCDGDRVMT